MPSSSSSSSAILFSAIAIFFFFSASAIALPPPRGFFINCGAEEEIISGEIKWITDDGFIASGNRSSISIPNLAPTLSNLRFFPEIAAKKNCFVLPCNSRSIYLVRTSYFYGGFDGGVSPPIFDQIVDGSIWSAVDTAEDFSLNLTSYFEVVVRASGRKMSVCLGRNGRTVGSPFISTLEVVELEDSMYNATDLDRHLLATVARHRFGHSGAITSYPEDPYHRNWAPFPGEAGAPTVESHADVTPADFWNLPPAAAFRRGITASRGKTIVLRWPPADLPPANYYIALYFQDNRTPSPYSWRVFDVSVNDAVFVPSVNASADGVMLFSGNWPLSGPTFLSLTPALDSPVGPVVNAGEVLRLVPRNPPTVSRDVIAMEELARSLSNIPSDWTGDPCLPPGTAWTGIECSQGKPSRVISLLLEAGI
ncbi:leucine-rich repeat (LRR) family protein isoform X2 [Wolffia australiana]